MKVGAYTPGGPRVLLEKPAPVPVTGQGLYDYFLQQEEGHDADHLAFLDRGIDNSPLKEQIPDYPLRLIAVRPAEGASQPFPLLGKVPRLENLDFLHPDISHACVAVGSWHEGELHTRWLGRNATTPAQMWSATKAYPMVRTTIRANQVAPQTPLERCRLADSSQSVPVTEAFDAIVSYRQGGSASNRLARTLKHLHTPEGLEGWLKATTGNQNLTFRGGYGEPPSMARPTLKDGAATLLASPGQEHKGANLVSAYDLTRMMAHLGWHYRLPAEKRLPDLADHGADTLARAFGTDSARFLEAAWEALGLADRIENPVVLSKMGFGLSDERNQWEEVYSAFIQFTDKQTGRSHQLALALKGFKAPGERAAQKLDARMATEIALLTQKVVDGQL